MAEIVSTAEIVLCTSTPVRRSRPTYGAPPPARTTLLSSTVLTLSQTADGSKTEPAAALGASTRRAPNSHCTDAFTLSPCPLLSSLPQTTMMRSLKLAVATHLLLWGVCHGTPKGVSGETLWEVGDGPRCRERCGRGRAEREGGRRV